LHVGALSLEDFRNYSSGAVEFAEGLNLVVGRNAQGKTNLLEAVYCLSGLGSPRGPDGTLVRKGAERALLHADVTRRAREIHIDMEIRPGRGTRALINKSPIAATKALGELAVSVFFGPDELSLVKGSPDGRRRFLDDLVIKLRPARQAIRKEWERTLKQRNALLRKFPKHGAVPASDRDQLAVWNEAFYRAGAALARERLAALAALLPYAQARYQEVAGGGALSLTYVSSWLPEDRAREVVAGDAISDDELAALLAERVDYLAQREIERGATLVGPQRDDVSVLLMDRTPGEGELLEARSYASQGDQRTAALALKLAEHDLLTAELDEPPILLLDDVFSELDPARRMWLREAVRGAGQTILSSAEMETWAGFGAERVYEVTAGEVRLHE
jgi:DNA replication and repair protein RecF